MFHFDLLTLHKKLRVFYILNFFVYLIYAIRARIANMNYSKKLKIFNILNYFYVFINDVLSSKHFVLQGVTFQLTFPLRLL